MLVSQSLSALLPVVQWDPQPLSIDEEQAVRAYCAHLREFFDADANATAHGTLPGC
jgi:hypothetical protein